jgi:hypothetical protein
MSKKPLPSPTLYKELMNFSFSEIEDECTFQQRLEVENAWSATFAKQVIFEYKHFLFLAATCSHPVTPSEEVDQVWHLHLLYSRSYWDDLCSSILKFPLHHVPTKGGKSEQRKFIQWYRKTLQSYEETFDKKPSAIIWPSVEVRFQLEPIVKKRKSIRCYLGRISFFITLMFAIYLIAKYEYELWSTLFILILCWGGLYSFITGEVCDKCCQRYAMEIINNKTEGDKTTILWRCKYCSHSDIRVTDNSISSCGGGCGGGCGG